MSRNHDLIYCSEELKNAAETVIIEKGDRVVVSGTWPHYVYVVLQGIASVQYTSGKGRSVEASQFLQGDFIGEMNAICSQPFIFDAVACTRMKLLKIPAADRSASPITLRSAKRPRRTRSTARSTFSMTIS